MAAADGQPLTTLDESAFERYQREGYLLLESALSDRLVERARDRLHGYAAGDREPSFAGMVEPDADADDVAEAAPEEVRKFEGLGMVRDDEVFAAVAEADGVVDPVADLLGPHLKLLRSAAMCKPPGIGSKKGLHQDAAYYPIRPHDHATAWVALDEATPENGCMTVAPGGHHDGVYDHRTEGYDTDIVIPDSAYDGDFVEVPMEPGDVLLTHCLVPHRTGPNRTENPRRALIMAYMDARSRFTEPPAERAPWVDSVAIRGHEFPGCV
jgi:ectoine hydroxylase-related dioxygenase (phytanoyl-CoA dioxygenase family)